MMEQVRDTVNEGQQVDILENLDRGGIIGVNQHNQSDPKEFAMNLVVIGKLGHKVVIQEGKNILRILDPWQGVLPLVSTIDSETRSSLLAEVRKGRRDGGLHDGMKQMGACFSNIDFSEGGHGLHHIHGAPDPTDGSGVLEYLGKPFIDPVDPGNGSETVVGWFSIMSLRRHIELTCLSSVVNKSPMSNSSPKTKLMMSRQSLTVAGGDDPNRRK